MVPFLPKLGSVPPKLGNVPRLSTDVPQLSTGYPHEMRMNRIRAVNALSLIIVLDFLSFRAIRGSASLSNAFWPIMLQCANIAPIRPLIRPPFLPYFLSFDACLRVASLGAREDPFTRVPRHYGKWIKVK